MFVRLGPVSEKWNFWTRSLGERVDLSETPLSEDPTDSGPRLCSLYVSWIEHGSGDSSTLSVMKGRSLGLLRFPFSDVIRLNDQSPVLVFKTRTFLCF